MAQNRPIKLEQERLKRPPEPGAQVRFLPGAPLGNMSLPAIAGRFFVCGKRCGHCSFRNKWKEM